MHAQLAVMWFAGRVLEQGCQVGCDVTVAAGYKMPRVLPQGVLMAFLQLVGTCFFETARRQ